MTNKKTTKRSLMTSVMALLICFTMLLGTTYAWFTHAVSVTDNVIKSGTLKIGLEKWDAETDAWVDATTGPIFNYANWEPGYTQIVHLRVVNKGTLALKWQAGISCDAQLSDLADAINVYVRKDENVPADGNNTVKEFIDRVDRYGFEEAAAAKEFDRLTLREFVEDLAQAADIDRATQGYLKQGEITNISFVLQMDPEAGNEYQDLDVGGKFNLTFLATQYTEENDSYNTNDYDEEAKFLHAVAEFGGFAMLNGILNEGFEIDEKADAKIQMNQGAVIGGSVINRGALEMIGGTIDVDAAGVENLGEATFTDTTFNAGSAMDYSNISRDGSETEYNNVTINSEGGGVAAVYGATVVFNSGSVEVNSKSTSGRYLFYTEGAGSTIIINDGNFDFDKTQNQKRAYIYADADTTVYVNGGTFGKASTRNGYTAGILGDGKVIITGGTFGFNPTKWVADGFKAVKDDATGTWTVEPKVATDIKNDLANGGNAVFGDDVVVNDSADYETNGNGKTALSVSAGQTIDGNGYSIDAPNSNGTWDSAVSASGGTIKNLTVAGGFRGIFITKGGNNGEKVILDNVIINGPTYTISCDSGSGKGLEATNSVFNGWTSYAATIGEVTFTNCVFGKGAGYAFCRPYAPTTFVGCDFEAGYRMDLRAAVTFENCTIGGEPLTTENLSTLVSNNINNATVK